jgi:hypothetical protein
MRQLTVSAHRAGIGGEPKPFSKHRSHCLRPDWVNPHSRTKPTARKWQGGEFEKWSVLPELSRWSLLD